MMLYLTYASLILLVIIVAFFIILLSSSKGRRGLTLALRSLWLHKLRTARTRLRRPLSQYNNGVIAAPISTIPTKM